MATKTTNKTESADKYLKGTLAYYADPFSRTEVSPKIPDGKMETSIGVQQTKSAEYTVTSALLDEANFINGYVTSYIFLLPGIGSPLQIWNTNKAAGDVTTGDNQPSLEFFVNNNDFFAWNPLTKIVDDKTPVTWRMVSQGLQVWPITSTTATSGLFESFSVPIPTSEMLADTFPAGNAFDNTNPRLTPALVANYENNIQRLRESKTYVSGTIQQLRNLQFRQLPNDPSHSPIHIAKTYALAGGATFNGAVQDPAAKVNFLEDIIDHSFHMRVIRLRIPNGSKFIVNTCTNFEFQYRLNSPIAGFQTYNDRHVQMERVADAVAADEGNQHGTQARMVSPYKTQKRGTGPSYSILEEIARQVKPRSSTQRGLDINNDG